MCTTCVPPVAMESNIDLPLLPKSFSQAHPYLGNDRVFQVKGINYINSEGFEQCFREKQFP